MSDYIKELSTELKQISKEISQLKQEYTKLVGTTEGSKIKQMIKDEQYQALFYIEKIENLARQEKE